MYRSIPIFLLIEIILCQISYPQTPIKFRSFWYLSERNGNRENYSKQLGQNFLNNIGCPYIDDEEPYEILSNAQYEDELPKFDKSLISLEQQSIVFMEVHQYVFRQH
ncbi:unnamed protein product [Rotaria sordida]|uniref:Uncharacterized protein n=1 Tax=Rotaria sordida TaxID=392033 RepID=A0A819ITJ7_9BILA|nr:unnamed protein product [Rotaria sordida]CAF3917043.1 unnamed protein product [Rotaria sordida]